VVEGVLGGFRVWTVIGATPGGQKCVGFATLAQVWDVSNFHCEGDRSRARLVQRISTVLEEHVGERTSALVHVSEEAEKDWLPMLESMGAQRANRWVVPTGKEVPYLFWTKRDPKKLPGHAVESDSSANHETERST